MKNLAAILLMAIGGACSAQSTSGNELHRWFGFHSAVMAESFVNGALDMESVLGDPNAPFYCAPAGATKSQAFDIVKMHLANKPEERHKNASLLILLALKNAWPCRK